MQLIPLTATRALPQAASDARMLGALGGVIACLGGANFQKDALAQLNRWMPIAWWSVYRLFDDRPPTLHASAAFRTPDRTQDSWKAYRDGLYKIDETFLAAKEQAQTQAPMLVHWHAHEIPFQHRERIYNCHGLSERLSIVCASENQALLAVNLYRTWAQSAFSDDEVDSLGTAAGLLISCVHKQMEFSLAPARTDEVLGVLTKREREVCEGMLRGLTYDGIAVSLGVSPGTVKTYRDRAFGRLQIHHRNELFALVSGTLG